MQEPDEADHHCQQNRVKGEIRQEEDTEIRVRLTRKGQRGVGKVWLERGIE